MATPTFFFWFVQVEEKKRIIKRVVQQSALDDTVLFLNLNKPACQKKKHYSQRNHTVARVPFLVSL